MTAASIDVRILACFMGLLIVAGALDTLPDPPAVKPPSIQKNPVSQLLHPIAVATPPCTAKCLASGLHVRAGLIPSRQGFEGAASADDPFVLQATDASPPRLSVD
jgi:hypothetical protein